MLTPEEITSRVADAFARTIQDPIYGVVQANASPIIYHVYVKIEQQEELYLAPFSPFIDTTTLAEGTRVELKYNRDGVLAITEPDDAAARESYSSDYPVKNFVTWQHNHETSIGGGQLNATNIFNSGAVPLSRGGGAADLSGFTTGSLIYKAADSFAELADVATGNALISGGVGAAPLYGKIGLTTHISGTLPIANGGTNITTYTTGDLLYASAANVLSKLAGVATGNALISGGVGTAFSWGKIGLTTHVSGTLPVANGGTGAASFTANSALLGNGTSAFQEVAPGTSGNVLTSNGTTWTSAAPTGGFAGLTDDGTDIRLTTSTDTFTVGGTGESLGRLTVRGVADTPQLAIQLNATQTQPGVLITNSGSTTVYSLSNGGDIYGLGAIEIDGAFNHDGSTFGALGAAPASQVAQTGDIKDLLVTFGFMSSTPGATNLDTDEGLVTGFLRAEAATTASSSANIAPGVAPTGDAQVDGNIWNDNAQNAMMMYLAGMAGAFGKVLFTQTNTVSVNNTGTEGTLLGTGVGSLTLPADYLTVGKTLLIPMAGFFGTLGTTGSLEIRVKLGGTAVAGPSTDTVSSASDGTGWFFLAVITCRTVGGSGTVFAQGVWFSEGAVTHVSTVVAVTVDTTGTLAIDVTADWGPTNNGISCSNAMVIALN